MFVNKNHVLDFDKTTEALENTTRDFTDGAYKESFELIKEIDLQESLCSDVILGASKKALGLFFSIAERSRNNPFEDSVEYREPTFKEFSFCNFFLENFDSIPRVRKVRPRDLF